LENGSLWLQPAERQARASMARAVHLTGVTDEQCVMRSLEKGRDCMGTIN
jgi:hypothetical protein